VKQESEHPAEIGPNAHVALPRSGIDIGSLETYVLAATSRHRSLNDIITHLCQISGWNWREAQEFHRQTLEVHSLDLHRSRRRVYGIAGAMMCATGAIELLATVGFISYCSSATGLLSFACDRVLHGRSFIALLLVLGVTGFASLLTGSVGLVQYFSKSAGPHDTSSTTP
jgi:hypothetical protein